MLEFVSLRVMDYPGRHVILIIMASFKHCVRRVRVTHNEYMCPSIELDNIFQKCDFFFFLLRIFKIICISIQTLPCTIMYTRSAGSSRNDILNIISVSRYIKITYDRYLYAWSSTYCNTRPLATPTTDRRCHAEFLFRIVLYLKKLFC